jgi:hypothetical protein
LAGPGVVGHANYCSASRAIPVAATDRALSKGAGYP